MGRASAGNGLREEAGASPSRKLDEIAAPRAIPDEGCHTKSDSHRWPHTKSDSHRGLPHQAGFPTSRPRQAEIRQRSCRARAPSNGAYDLGGRAPGSSRRSANPGREKWQEIAGWGSSLVTTRPPEREDTRVFAGQRACFRRAFPGPPENCSNLGKAATSRVPPLHSLGRPPRLAVSDASQQRGRDASTMAMASLCRGGAGRGDPSGFSPDENESIPDGSAGKGLRGEGLGGIRAS